jgi:hypothetical protein
VAGLKEAEAARRAAFGALGLESAGTNGSDRGAALREAADKAAAVASEEDERATARAWRAFAAALKAGSRLVVWQQAVREAQPESRRHLESAHLLAREALAAIDLADPALAPVGTVLTAITGVSDATEIDAVVDELRRVPLPLPLARPTPRFRAQARAPEQAAPEPDPIAFATFELAGEPAPDATIVRANHLVDLRLELRLTEWPEWAKELRATAVSIAGESAKFPSFTFARPESRDGDGLWTVAETKKLVITVIQPLGDAPLTFTLLVELAAKGRRLAVRTVGQRELYLWSSDDAPTSLFTGLEQLDVRVAEILALIHENDAFGSDSERRAFTRFLRGLLRATLTIQNRRHYADARLDERRFQRDLLMLLDQQDALAGRVVEGGEIGGGETDLVHDGVVAELKVVKHTEVTKENAPQFLGQTTSYSSGLGGQLGIAVILDLSEKKNPLGHPANYVHFLGPELHGVTDPAYPSHIAVLVVNGNTPLPSDYAGERVAASDPIAHADARPDSSAAASG